MIRCTLPWEQLNVAVGDDVRVCCWTNAPLGKVADFPTLESVWNGEAIRAFRRTMLTGKLGGICPETCPHFITGAHSSEKFAVSNEASGPRRAIREVLDGGGDEVPVPPLRLTASLDDVCSLRCVDCGWNTGRFRIHPNFHEWLAAAGASLEHLELLGGEPFLSPRVLDLLEHAKAHPPRYEFSFITALVKLPLALLRGIRLGEIIVSVDGATKAVYESVRRGARWETLLGNLSRLLEFQRSAAHPFRVQVNFTVQRRNFKDIPAAVRLFARMGVPLIFRAVILPPGDAEDPFHRPELAERLSAAIKKGLAASRDPKTRESLEAVRDFLRNSAAYSLKK
jgi:sulfatase maturation enzyme AslB (radical SAM superfamily)